MKLYLQETRARGLPDDGGGEAYEKFMLRAVPHVDANTADFFVVLHWVAAGVLVQSKEGRTA